MTLVQNIQKYDLRLSRGRRFNGGTEIACTAPDTAGAADA